MTRSTLLEVDELTDTRPPHGSLWGHTMNALNFMEANQEPTETESATIEITPDDDLKIEMLIRRFLRRLREQDQEAFLETLSEDFQDLLSRQHLKPTVYFLKDLSFLAKAHLFFEAQEYGLTNLGLFRRIELTFAGRIRANINFFMEQDKDGDWSISCLEAAPT